MMQKLVSFGNLHNLIKRNGLYTCSFLLLLCALPVISKCPECSTKDIQTIQMKCSVEDDNLIQAESAFDTTGNSTKFCRTLYSYYFCVGKYVAHCLETIIQNYGPYHSSPFDCHPTTDDTIKLQGYLISCDATTRTTDSTTLPQDMTVVAVRSSTTSKTQTQHTSSHVLNTACDKGFSSILGFVCVLVILLSQRHELS